jgi:hypothetical protein
MFTPDRTSAVISTLFAIVLFPSSAFAQGSLNEGAYCDAVKNSQTIIMRYSNDPESESPREIYPHALGYTKKRKTLLLALQIKGYSKSGELEESPMPGWRTFRVDRIRTAQLKGEVFEAVKPNISRYKAIVNFACVNKSLEGLIP